MAKRFQHWIDRGEAGREQFFGLLQTGLDLLNQGLTVFNEELELVAWNEPFFALLEFPLQFARVGTPFEEFVRYNAKRGEYGEGDLEELIRGRMQVARTFQSHYTERVRPNGKVIAVRGEPLPGKGFITVYTDVTAQRRFEQMLREQNQLLEARVQERTRDLQASVQALRTSENRLRVIADPIPALDAQPTDVAAAMAALAQLIGRSLPQNLRLEGDEPSPPIWALTDPIALHGALVSLVLAARAAMPQGGTLRLRTTVALVDAREAGELGVEPGRYAKLTVGHTGTAAQATSAKSGGLLHAMVREFAQRSRGALRVDTTTGLGTTVALWLPGSEPREPA
jgi:signal transduction histidine kinase